MKRRDCLTLLGVTAAGTAWRSAAYPAGRKKVAVIMTVYRPNSHADVRVPKLLNGYFYNGKQREPRLEIASMYTDQVPQNDLSRGISTKYNVPIFPTVAEALTLGAGKLAIDGVFLIGEHGNYPENEKGQKLYPRYRLYKEIVEVFRASGRAVPVFNDKHFSVDWREAKWMFDQSRELGFGLLAGSSIPLTWRRPPLEIKLGSNVEKAVIVGDGPKESYGFHLLEGLQAMAERRRGGETGIAAVRCLEGNAVWSWTDQNPWAGKLLDTAVSQIEDRTPGSPRENARNPILFQLEYSSGLSAAVYIINGHVHGRGFAATLSGVTEPVYTEYLNQNGRPWSHSSGQVYFMEELVLTGKAAYPAERTLLATGALAALMDSSFQGGVRLETPHLQVAYTAPRKSLYNTGPMPPLAG
jgi:hypothetical protein